MRVSYRVCHLAIGMLLTIWAPQRALAQVPVRVITLEKALDLASEQSEQVLTAEAGVRQAEGERLRARSGLFPQLTGTASYQRTLASEFSGLFRGSVERPVEDGDGIDLPFGRKNIWQVNLNLAQNLYSGGRIGALADLAGASRSSALANLEITRGQVELDTAEAFYDAAVADRFVQIAEATVRQAEETIRQVEAGFRVGTQPEFEVLRARVDRDNQIPVLNRSRMDRELAYLRLKQMLEIPADEPITLDVNLDAETLELPSRFAARFIEMEARFAAPATEPIDRAAVRASAALVERQEANLRSVEAQGRPNLSFGSNYSNVTYPSGVFSDFGNIRTNWTVGASLNFPILTGGRQRADETVARAQLEAQRAQLDLTEELADVDARSAWAEVITAQSTWQASSATVGLARRAYAIAEVRFRSGVSTQLELSDSRLQLQQAEANHAQAARDLQVARIRVALLPDLPIASFPARPF